LISEISYDLEGTAPAASRPLRVQMIFSLGFFGFIKL